MGKRKNKRNQQDQTGTSNGNKEENSEKEIVLKAYMHCQGCATKVVRCLQTLDGVEQVRTETSNHKVIVVGQKADPVKVLERIQKKYSKNAELISPKPKPNCEKESQSQKKQDDQLEIITAVLKMYMHCDGCARDIKKNIERLKGVVSAEPDMKKSQVTVRGAIDPPKLAETITKRLGKHVEIVKQEAENKRRNNDNQKAKEDNVFHYPPQYSLHHIYPSQVFSDQNVFSCSLM